MKPNLAKKIKISLLIFVLSIFFLWYIIISVNPLRKSSKALTRDLFRQTPLGTSMADVKAFAVRQGYKVNESQDAGIYEQDETIDQNVGVKSIWVYPGSYIPVPFHVYGLDITYYCQTNVEFSWAFDKNGKLIDIWVKKSHVVP